MCIHAFSWAVHSVFLNLPISWQSEHTLGLAVRRLEKRPGSYSETAPTLSGHFAVSERL